ncbi:MAG: ABC transporter permease [Pseudonocardiaceae bacterium]|nr:ABC transporter permease [Pseudonocardiaceae bacterium]
MERQHPGEGPGSGAPRSAYPPRIAELVPKARALAAKLGEIPSRNRLMSELRVGAPKATELRSALLDATRSGVAERARPSAGPRPRSTPAPPGPAVESESTGTEPGPGNAGPARPGAEPAARGSGSGLATGPANPNPAPAQESATGSATGSGGRVPVWPVLLLAAPAFVAIWSGWVGLGSLTGFGVVHPLPGIWDSLTLNTAITLPIGVETYAAYAIRAWLAPGVPARARRFAKRSAIGALCLGALGQIAYHLMAAAHMQAAPWQITALVSCLPVAVLGMGAALIHLLTDPATDGEAVR